MQRRTLLGLGLAGGALLALAGGGIALMYEPAWRHGRLETAGRNVLGAIARAVLDGTLPAQRAEQAAAIDAHLVRMNATLAAMSPHTQREIADLLAMLAMAPGRRALAGLASSWPEASVAELQAALQSMRQSSLLLRRQAYGALRDLTHAAYYSDPSAWSLLGYPGPRLLS
jgi:hypothetical protein